MLDEHRARCKVRLMTTGIWWNGHALALAVASERDDDAPRGRRLDHSAVSSGTRVVSPAPDDAAIVARIRAGDEHALTELVDRFYLGLVTYAEQALGARDWADDVVQELFIRLWNRRGEWVLRGSLPVYLYSATRNAVRNARAAHGARGRAEGKAAAAEMAARHESAESALQAIESDELMLVAQRVVAALPERSRDVYTLARTGLSSTEIGAVLGIAPSTVRTLLGRAIAALERAIGPLLVVAAAVCF
jgi:RNA polymerase sigma-70 factor (ECF subfamily)